MSRPIKIDLENLSYSELDPKWSLPLVQGLWGGVLTKLDVFTYYQSPNVRRKLYEALKGNTVTVIRKFSPDSRPVLTRHLPKRNQGLIVIEKAFEDPDDPKDLLYWIHRRTIEFHKSVPVDNPKTDEYVIDVDLGPAADPDEAKKAVIMVKRLLENLPEVKKVEIWFSGGSGFYVKGILNKKVDVNKAREKLKGLLSNLVRGNPRLTLSKPGFGQIRLDLSPMKPGGSYRAPYSLNVETGLVSVPIRSEDELWNFDPSKAVPQRVARLPKQIKIWR